MAADEQQQVRSKLARSLLEYLESSSEATFASVIETNSDGDFDIVDVAFEPELPSNRTVSIENVEPIRLRFFADDSGAPLVSALRPNFPIGNVHTNFERGIDGLFLCVWEESWRDLQRLLTPHALVERIRSWLTRMATNAIHDDGQQLEPLLASTAHILLVPSEEDVEGWTVTQHHQVGNVWVYLAENLSSEEAGGKVALPIFALQTPAQVHGALRSQPTSFADLHDMLIPMGIDLREQVADWILSLEHPVRTDLGLLIVISFPIKRDEDSEVEGQQVWAFVPEAKLGEFAEGLGKSFVENGKLHTHVGAQIDPEYDPQIGGLRVIRRIDPLSARRFSGDSNKTDRLLLAVGAGALGSNVVINSSKAGIGAWTIIDNDVTLPHNLVRQAHPEMMTGFAKSGGLAVLANQLSGRGDNSAIVADVLSDVDPDAEVAKAIQRAEIVLDFSASPAVLGFISDHAAASRAASMFFAPHGHDLVALFEDQNRATKLDEIEAQYIFAAATRDDLGGHLDEARTDFIRYANACQNLSRPLEPWKVQTLAGLGAGALVGLQEEESAIVWRLNKDGAIKRVKIEICGSMRAEFEDWRFTIAKSAIDRMKALRAQALPDETGGILLGTFDYSRRVAHILGVLPAPPDSEQSPTHFIRGSATLKPAVDELSLKSAGMIRYLGEWHSHPPTSPAKPSGDDEKLFSYLHQNVGPVGEPFFMAILNDDEIWLRGGWSGAQTSETSFDI